MWPVDSPGVDADEAFVRCSSGVRDKGLKRRLKSISGDVRDAADDYATKAASSCLHLVPQADHVGPVKGDELVWVYNQQMAKKGRPCRSLYDQIKLLPDNDRCPFCDHRNVSTLDHVLPKSLYPILAVMPDNLVGSCSECNKAKLDVAPTSADDAVLHPYFDRLDGHQWLFASVVEDSPAAVVFFVSHVADWDNSLNARLTRQFDLLGLAKLYSNQAAREIADSRHNLQRHFDFGGGSAVRSELSFQWDSRTNNRPNSWQTATYQALAQSDWFCNGGFAAT